MTQNMEIEDQLVSNNDLIQSLQKAGIAKKLIDGDDGRLIKEMINAIVEQAEYTLCNKIDLGNQASVIRMIERIRFLKYELLPGLKSFITNGEYSFEEAKERGIL